MGSNLITPEVLKHLLIISIEEVESMNFKELAKLKNLKEMLINPTYIVDDYPSNPGLANLHKISATGEKAFQRGIYNSEHSILTGLTKKYDEKVIWLDLEIPVSLSSKARRRCADLIGIVDNYTPALCELKYKEKGSSDHPLYGIYELLIYYYLILCNHEKLDSHKIYHKNARDKMPWKTFNDNSLPYLLLVANNDYWNYWRTRIDLKWFNTLLSRICLTMDVRLRLYEATNETFIKQKETLIDGFKPYVTDPNWQRIMEL
jgi:hypothetical protein